MDTFRQLASAVASKPLHTIQHFIYSLDGGQLTCVATCRLI